MVCNMCRKDDSCYTGPGADRGRERSLVSLRIPNSTYKKEVNSVKQNSDSCYSIKCNLSSHSAKCLAAIFTYGCLSFYRVTLNSSVAARVTWIGPPIHFCSFIRSALSLLRVYRVYLSAILRPLYFSDHFFGISS